MPAPLVAAAPVVAGGAAAAGGAGAAGGLGTAVGAGARGAATAGGTGLRGFLSRWAQEYAKRRAIEKVSQLGQQQREEGNFFQRNRLIFLMLAIAAAPGCMAVMVVLSPIVLVVLMVGMALATGEAMLQGLFQGMQNVLEGFRIVFGG